MRCPFASKGRFFQRLLLLVSGMEECKYFKKPFNFFLGVGGSNVVVYVHPVSLGKILVLPILTTAHVFQMGGEKPPNEAFGFHFPRIWGCEVETMVQMTEKDILPACAQEIWVERIFQKGWDKLYLLRMKEKAESPFIFFGDVCFFVHSICAR